MEVENMGLFNWWKDRSGINYSVPGNRPAADGAKVKITTNNGPVPGTMKGGHVVPDKKKT
jgi:hypothetical protein